MSYAHFIAARSVHSECTGGIPHFLNHPLSAQIQGSTLPIVNLLSTAAVESKSGGMWESDDDSPQVCQNFDASFHGRDNFTGHIRAQLKGERTFQCDLCGVRFIKDYHERKH